MPKASRYKKSRQQRNAFLPQVQLWFKNASRGLWRSFRCHSNIKPTTPRSLRRPAIHTSPFYMTISRKLAGSPSIKLSWLKCRGSNHRTLFLLVGFQISVHIDIHLRGIQARQRLICRHHPSCKAEGSTLDGEMLFKSRGDSPRALNEGVK